MSARFDFVPFVMLGLGEKEVCNLPPLAPPQIIMTVFAQTRKWKSEQHQHLIRLFEHVHCASSDPFKSPSRTIGTLECHCSTWQLMSERQSPHTSVFLVHLGDLFGELENAMFEKGFP